jgi:pimeloyl-ACP methyl ester carboxylesterase
MSMYATTASGDRVAYDLRGSGPALIFVAGAGQFRATDPVTAATAESVAERGATTIVYDRLGRGESQVAGPIDLARELAAIAALIDAAGGSAVLCGHSSGCTIALAAATSGLPVTGLVLWEAPIGGISGGAQAWADEVARRTEAGDLEGALVHYMKDMPPEWLEGARQSPMWPMLVGQVRSNGPDGESMAWAESAPLGELLAEVRVPVEVLYGAQTLPIMRSAADAVVHAVPGAVQKEVAGANHGWDVAAMTDELVSFLAVVAEQEFAG